MSRASQLFAHLRAWKQAGRAGPGSQPSHPTSGDQEQPAHGRTRPQADGRLANEERKAHDIRKLALGLFPGNVDPLVGLARQQAATRAQEFTEALLNKLAHAHPDGFSQANDPGFQYALHTAQKEHARSGEQELSDLLIDLLKASPLARTHAFSSPASMMPRNCRSKH